MSEFHYIKSFLRSSDIYVTSATLMFIIQITAMIVILTQLEATYDKNLVLLTRREYIKLQQKLEECERRHNEIFNPNIGKPEEHGHNC